MALYAISDLHLSLSTNKSMEVFPGWENYVERIKTNWINKITTEDTVVLAGDSSWGISLEQSLEDFKYINTLPGRKILLKGNHDFWWTTKNKMDIFFAENGLNTLNILNNNHYAYNDFAICGTRGWINENEEPADKKVLLREAGRLEASIKSALTEKLKPIVFLHYPPLYANDYNYEILDVLHKYNIEECFYGHIHGKSSGYAIQGDRDGISYSLISSDILQFEPKLIK